MTAGLLAALGCGLAARGGGQEPAASTQNTLVTQFTYTADVPDVTAGVKGLDVWLPVPSDSPQQTVRELTVDSPVPYRITTEPRWHNRMAYLHANAASGPFAVTVRFVVARKVEVGAQQAMPTISSAEMRRLLRPDSKVPVGGRWRTLAQSNAQGQTTPRAQMQALFEHVVATMQYDYKKESPHLGEGDVAFVCDYKKGNCSDLHSYLISLARSLNIPAVLEYGFPITGVPAADPLPTEGTIGGYHCWMWYYDNTPTPDANRAPRGWTPLDAADARRWLDAGRADRKDYLFGHLIAPRSAVAMSRGRDLTLAPPQKGRALNCFIYPYAEADGKPIEVHWTLRYRRL